MANKDDYLTEYRQFFENFAKTVNPKDQLPVKLASYKLINSEVVGGIIDWTSQYLTQKKCPQSLLPTLIKIIIDETRRTCRKQPVICGFNPADNAYEPLKLMQTVISITYDVCLQYLDNSKLCSLPSPDPAYNQVSSFAIKNSRRCMEDRHVVIQDLSSLFVEQESSPSSYYAIFDGHAGHSAAAYSCAHLHQFLAESKDFISNPEQALREAFYKTDALFLEKCKVENLSSGTTAVCALILHKEKLLYIAWVGDSQAILVSQEGYVQCVQPHKPSREDEKKRIEKDGGLVLFWDTWRVNGQLAVSRAIGDSEYKPYVTAVPDILEIRLKGKEDFLILACDGLWDSISEDLAAQTVYNTLAENSDDIESVSQRLVQLAKEHGSLDNITVIVVFLRETSKIAAEAAHWANSSGSLIMDTLDNANTNNPFALTANDIILQKEGLLLDLGKQNGEATTNGKRSTDDEEFDDDEDDLGPETDVDAMDDVLVSPLTKNHVEIKEEEKATLETHDTGVTKASLREEAATPPADSVHEPSGLVDNVAESCEDSDDEWNYYKGDLAADKENVPPSETDKEVCDIIDNDEMSHLNPNAAEFVPSSPNIRTDSPVIQSLRNDAILAQSPKKSTVQDIKVPDLQEFECEIKSRPSDVHENHENSVHNLSTEEIMVNFLNGKNIEDIDFQPNSTPKKTFKADEFHFGPNATPFSTPAKFDTSEALSTKAVFGDESTASYLEKGFDSCSEFSKSHVGPMDNDPMSTSFYLDKDDDNDVNPFDLNKVHVLPDNLEDFLNKPQDNSMFDDTISDLPEHDPALMEVDHEPVKEETPPVQEEVFDCEMRTADANLQQTPVSQVEEFLAQERESILLQNATLQSPVSKTPDLSRTLDLGESSATPVSSDFPVQPQLMMACEISPAPPQSPIQAQPPISPRLQVHAQSPNSSIHSPTPPQSPICTQSPIPSHSPVPPKSPVDFLHSSVDKTVYESLLEPVACVKTEPIFLSEPVLIADIPDVVPNSQVPSHEIESPLDDITSSVKDSPVLASTPSDKPEENNLIEIADVLVQEESRNKSLLYEEFSSPESKVETESVATTDVNSFLERSLLPDVASPLSPTEEDTLIAASSMIEKVIESPPQDVVLKSEIIAPEFPVQQKVTTPSEVVQKPLAQKKPLVSKPKVGGVTSTATAKKPPAAKASPITKTTSKPLKTAAAPAPTKPPVKTVAKTPTTPTASPKPISKLAPAKGPLTNGVAKASPVGGVAKAAAGTTAKTAPLSKPARPATAPPLSSAKPPIKPPTASATSRPATLVARTTGTTVRKTTTVTSAVTNAKITVKSTTATSPKETPKPRPLSANPATTRTKPTSATTKPPVTKTLDVEKSLKEAANKQTASRTVTATKTTARKVEPKVPTTKTSLTKTSTASARGPNDLKKPQELVKHAASKTKVITKTTTKETQVHENGVANKIITSTNSTTTIEEPQLIKDVSPIIENSQLLD